MTGLEAGPGVLMQGVEKDRSENVTYQQGKGTRVNNIQVEVQHLFLLVTSGDSPQTSYRPIANITCQKNIRFLNAQCIMLPNGAQRLMLKIDV